MNRRLKEGLIPVIAVCIALLIGAIIILAMGENPIEAYYYMFNGAFSSEKAIARTLLEATPMIFTGLAVLFAFKGGMFNIGAQGQITIAALVVAGVGAFVTNKYINNVIVIVIFGVIAGALWAGIAGILKARLGIHEVISTIMLNYIALNVEQYLINYPLKQGGINGQNPQTPPVLDSARFAHLMPWTKEALNYGFIIAIIMVIIVWYIFEKTVLGYKIKAVGNNPTASENAGIKVKVVMGLTFAISGAIASFAGIERVLGGVGQYTYKQGLLSTLGFDGIAVALLGKNNPFGALAAAILFAALRVGGRSMQFNTNVPSQIVIMIQSLIILLIAGENIFRMMLEKKKEK